MVTLYDRMRAFTQAQTLYGKIETQQKRLDLLENESRGTIDALKDSIAILGVYLQEYGLETGPKQALTALRESGVDEAILLDLITQLGWEQVTTMGSQTDTGQERTLAVRQSERLWKYSPLYQWAVWLWTGWGLGDRIEVTIPENEPGQEWWDEFVTARRNAAVMGQDKINQLSDWLLVKGNRFLALFTATQGQDRGRTTIRVFDQDELTPVYNPDDRTDVWFWERRFTLGGSPATLYYPSWETLLAEDLEERWTRLIRLRAVSGSAQRADTAVEGTVVCIYHIAHNQKEENSVWGWPLSTTSGSWTRGHKQFAEARLGAALAIAQFVRRTSVQGGSRAVDSVISTIASTLSRSQMFDTNPPAAAGAWHVENQASKTEELPLRTGAGDAAEDNKLFSWMALLGSGLFPTSAGLDTSRWATAVEMDKAQSMVFERYQGFWSTQIRTLVGVVLQLGQVYGGLTVVADGPEPQITIDTFSLADFPSVASAIGQFSSQMLVPLVQNGVIDPSVGARLSAELWRIVLQALGVTSAIDLTSEEAFMPKPKPEPAPPPPEEEPVPAEEPAEEPPVDIVAEMMGRVIDRYRQGEIDGETAAEFILTEMIGLVPWEE